MDTASKYRILLQAAEIVNSKTSKSELLRHHEQVGGSLLRMLTNRRVAMRKSATDKSNPTGNPFLKKSGGPVPVDSKLTRQLDAVRGAGAVPETAYD